MKTVLAYLAGVMDSDGYIGVKRSTYAMRVTKDSGQPTYSERLCVKQVEPHAVVLLKETFSGSVTIQRPSAAKGRPLFYWQATDMKAAAALRQLLPFLRIKRLQAENCLRLRDAKNASKRERVAKGRGHAGSARRSAPASAIMQECYEKAKELNRVGVR